MASYNILKREVDAYAAKAEAERRRVMAYNRQQYQPYVQAVERFNKLPYVTSASVFGGAELGWVPDQNPEISSGERVIIQGGTPNESVGQRVEATGETGRTSTGREAPIYRIVPTPQAPADYVEGEKPRDLNLSQRQIGLLRNPTVDAGTAERLRAFGVNPNTALANQQSRNSAFSSQSQFDGRGVLQRALQGDL